jgi:hypothetical protein
MNVFHRSFVGLGALLIAIDALAFAYQSIGSFFEVFGFADFFTLLAMRSLIVFVIELTAK